MGSVGKSILLVNPEKQDDFPVNRINTGLCIVGSILVTNGHKVKLMDYAFLRDLKLKIRVPEIGEVIEEFKPDVIGVSVYTYLYDECKAMIEKISRCTKAPIILGGPHFKVFPEDMNDDNRISYIVRGEAELVIASLVEDAKPDHAPVIIDAPLPSPDQIPAINLDIVYGNQYLPVYQIQLSRGCPHKCSFCCVGTIAGKRVRARDLETCLNQIIEAKRSYPNIEVIDITDDCPTFDIGRFKRFLRMFSQAKTGCRFGVDNMRADLIDQEMIDLYKAAGGANIRLGVESGHSEVFKLIRKGESLKDIIKAAKLIRKNGLSLGLCFVIGLPTDNMERHSYSIKFAKALKPDDVYWNMCVPWPNTEVHEWFQTYGEIGNVRNVSSLIDPRVNFMEPIASSYDFPKEQRIKAWLMANMETTQNYLCNPRDVGKLFLYTVKYRLYLSFFFYILKSFSPAVARSIRSRTINSGDFLVEMMKRAYSLIRQKLVKQSVQAQAKKM